MFYDFTSKPILNTNMLFFSSQENIEHYPASFYHNINKNIMFRYNFIKSVLIFILELLFNRALAGGLTDLHLCFHL